MPLRRLWLIGVFTMLLIGLPLLGVALQGEPLEGYLAFPPMTRPREPEPFSWVMFELLVLLILVAVAPFVITVIRAQRSSLKSHLAAQFPVWGWLGLGLLGMAWVVAWGRFAWFEHIQAHTFTPIWLGYILVINALTYRRTGHCLLLNRPRTLLLLFPLSAAFWWAFEYLNRFVENWYYVGVSEFGAFEYFVYATLPFSTVLPAVLSTEEWFRSFPRISAGLDASKPVRTVNASVFPWLLIGAGATALLAMPLRPEQLFPLVWVAPLLLLAGLQAAAGQTTVFSTITKGDWRQLWLLSLAGLWCGFLWELWNVRSLAHWEYVIPFVHRFALFEMPLLGYAGYLPFGIMCGAIAQAAGLFSTSIHREQKYELM